MKLYPKGTKLSDIPPFHQGISWSDYVDLILADAKETALRDKEARAAAKAALDSKAVATKRDGYGWRGIPGNIATLR